MTKKICNEKKYDQEKLLEQLRLEKEKLKCSKAEHRFLFENMTQGVVYHNKNGNIVQANQAASDILGLSLDQIYGRKSTDPSWNAIKEDGSPFPGEIHPATVTLRTKEPVKDVVMGIYIPDKDLYRWIKINSIPEFDINKNEISQVVVTFEDITMLKKAESKAQDAAQAKSNFLSNMTHELRTPLNGVIGFTELLLETELNYEQRSYSSDIKNSAVTLLEVVNDVLDFSRIEAGKLSLKYEKINLLKVLKNTLDTLKHRAYEKNISLLMNIETLFPKAIKTDPTRFKQIVINLLGNAIKFTDKGEVELVVKFTPVSENKMKLYLGVSDTGIGIDEKYQKLILESFSQADTSSTRRYEGTGLGLTITNELLKMMGSQLEIESEIGKGSLFYFEVEVETEGKVHLYYPNLKKLNILFIEHNERTGKVTADLLSEFCKDIKYFKNYREAEEGGGFDNYSLFIIDWKEYKRNLNHWKEIISTKKIPIIFTANPFEVRDIEFENVHFYIQKPFKIDELLRKINKKISNININEFDSIFKERTKSLSENTYYILIAEDVYLNLKLLQTILKNYLPNVEIYSAENGEEAVEWVKKREFDLIFMDIQMPKKSGYEAFVEIRQVEENKSHYTPIIALTAKALKDEKDKMLNLGMDGYITKPIEKKELKAVLEVWLNIKGNCSQEKELAKKSIDDFHFNYQSLLNLVDGDAAFVNEIMYDALKIWKKYIIDIENDFYENRQYLIKELTHSIKGSAESMRCLHLSELASQLEKLSIEKDSSTMQKKIFDLKEEVKLLDDLF